jgi:Pyridoxamine 5'-phosphate oxidase
VTVTWDEEIDGILAGDLTAALAYCTPAGGAAVTPVAPIGLRDRDAGTVTFTTSLGFGRKLDRIERDPRIALAYHAREHGFSDSPRYVLVQGTATVVFEPDPEWLETGWLDGDAGVYAPHTEQGFAAPANKRLLLLGNGFLAKRNLKRARAGASAAG